MFIISSLNVFAQTKEVQFKRSQNKEFNQEYYVLIGSANLPSYENDKRYFWFKNLQVHQSVGRSGGFLLHGKFVSYYKGHELAEEGNFSFGLKDGVWRYWNKEGNITRVENWKSGSYNGELLDYDSTGTLNQKISFRNGKKNGVAYIGNDTLRYRNGNLHGMTYQTSSGIRKVGKYNNGVKTGKWIEGSDTLFYKNGKAEPFKPFFKRLFPKKDKSDKDDKPEKKKQKDKDKKKKKAVDSKTRKKEKKKRDKG